MANERIIINGKEYISMDHLIDCLTDVCLRYHYDGDVGSGDSENEGIEFVDDLLKMKIQNFEAYDAFVRSYVHKKYPQVFGKEKES